MKPSWVRTLVGSVSSLLVWSAHFVLVYTLQALGCDFQWDLVPLIGSNLLTVLLVVVTLPALALIAWIGWAGRRWQRRSHEYAREPDAARRWRFMGMLTLAIAILAFVATVMTAIPVVMLPPCAVT